MDKRKVIEAYRRGLFSVQECGQLLGLESLHLRILLSKEPHSGSSPLNLPVRYIK